MDESLVALLRQATDTRERIVWVEALPARPARYATPSAALPEALAAALATLGIKQLYAHQAAALDAARAGEHLGIVTATASGKTLCYQLAVLDRLLAAREDRALFLFPTKALAHDQLRSLDRLLAAIEASTTGDQPVIQPQRTQSAQRYIPQPSVPSVANLNTYQLPPTLSAATLDGDTPRGQRDALRGRAQIILSNPDMLHRNLLPDHRRWAAWLARLRFVVLDEAHTYRGVFGTHVAFILRRLRRLCAYYGNAPQFICCSATSANPTEHLAALCGAPVQLLGDDGAPQGARSFVFWNPPMIEDGRPKTEDRRRTSDRSSSTVYPLPSEGGRRRSTNVETAQVFATLVLAGIKTLAFARSRRGAELILRYAREALGSVDHRPTTNDHRMTRYRELSEHDTASDGRSSLVVGQLVAAYRAGYHADERRALEQAFLRGDVRGLVSTNALELGVDIGGVDAVVISGYPGTVASTWQQAGRAGRSQGQSLAVLVAQDDPLDQFYMRHPAQFFSRPHEQARVALQNPYILADQLCCAAAELPLSDADSEWFGSTMAALRDWLVRHNRLFVTADGTWAAGGKPAAEVNIRSADGAPLLLRDAESGRVIEQVPATRAPFEVHPGAVYLHQGDTYLIEGLSATEALARRANLDYYTQTRDETQIAIERVIEQREVGPATLCLGVVTVTRQVTGYRRKQHRSEAVLSEHDLALPPQSFRTQAVWWALPDSLSLQLERACAAQPDANGEGLAGALHAMEHAAIGLLPLFAQCDRWDIGGVSTARHPETGLASVFVYDGVPGGVGIAQVGYEQAAAWWAATRDLLRDCPCAAGCPACVQSPKCGSGNQPLSKRGALLLVAALLGTPLPANGRLVLPEARNAEQQSMVLTDLRERLARATAEPVGVRRLALLAALRYRIATERAGPLGRDRAARELFDQVEASIQQLLV